jgi:hypothetical protein
MTFRACTDAGTCCGDTAAARRSGLGINWLGTVRAAFRPRTTCHGCSEAFHGGLFQRQALQSRQRDRYRSSKLAQVRHAAQQMGALLRRPCAPNTVPVTKRECKL